MYLWGGAEYAVRQIPNEYKYKNDWMNLHAEEVETLIIGNSYTETGLNPEVINGISFNLSISGQYYAYSHFLFFKYAKRYKSLKTLILPITYFNFYTNIGDINSRMEEVYYRVYMESPFHTRDISYNIEMLYFKPLYVKILQHITGNDVNWCFNGWVPEDVENKSPVWNAEHVNKSLARIYTTHLFENVSANFMYILEILNYCKDHNVKLIMISTPYTKEFYNCLNKIQINHTQQIVNNLVQKYHLDYFDYRQDVRFKDEDFYDQSHLSNIGATKFTRILMKDIH